MKSAQSTTGFRRTATLAVAVLSLFAAGCGLVDYEQHMDAEMAYLKEFDEENKVLGDALEMPKIWTVVGKGKTQSDAFRTNFFLRPPIWIAPKYTTIFTSGKVSLYRFPGPVGYNLFFTIAELDKNPHTKAVIKGGMAPADFRKEVRGAVVQFMQREYKVNEYGWAADDKLAKVSFARKGRPGNMDFERQEFNDAPRGAKEAPKYHAFEVYYHSDGPYQASVIYEVPMMMFRDATARKAIDFSLRSLVLGGDAMARLQEQNMRAARKKASVRTKGVDSSEFK